MTRERPAEAPSATPDEQRGRQKIPRGQRERGLRRKEREQLSTLTGPRIAGGIFGGMRNAAGRLISPRFVSTTAEDAVLEVRMLAEQRPWLSPNARARRRKTIGLNRFERRRRQERLDWAATRRAGEGGSE